MNSTNIQRPIGFQPEEISALYNEEVITQHAEEAAFQWILRDDAAYAPNYTLKELADLDERVEANIDGLRVAGDVGWKICEEALGTEEPGEVFAAGVLAFESGDKERINSILELACSAPELERALISALGWISFQNQKKHIDELLYSERADYRRIAIAAYTIHRVDPGDSLAKAIVDNNPDLRARAIKAAAEMGKTDLIYDILKSISDSNEDCHFYAAWSAARLGRRNSDVIDVLIKITEQGGLYSEKAMAMAIRCMELSQAKSWYQQLRNNPEQLRLSAIAAGVIGDPELINDIIELMNIDEVKRVSGEAFAMITGVDLAYEDLDGDAPQNYETKPSDESEDEDVKPDPDEDLPWPVPELVLKWWERNKGKFKSGVRYLKGMEINVDSLQNVLINGNQRQRAAAALELALINPKQPLFETRAPGKEQLKRLT